MLIETSLSIDPSPSWGVGASVGCMWVIPQLQRFLAVVGQFKLTRRFILWPICISPLPLQKPGSAHERLFSSVLITSRKGSTTVRFQDCASGSVDWFSRYLCLLHIRCRPSVDPNSFHVYTLKPRVDRIAYLCSGHKQ